MSMYSGDAATQQFVNPMAAAAEGEANDMQRVAAERRVAFWMSEEEADAFLNALLSAWPSSHISSQVTERLLRRVASAHRALDRQSAAKTRIGSRTARCSSRRTRVERRRRRSVTVAAPGNN